MIIYQKFASTKREWQILSQHWHNKHFRAVHFVEMNRDIARVSHEPLSWKSTSGSGENEITSNRSSSAFSSVDRLKVEKPTLFYNSKAKVKSCRDGRIFACNRNSSKTKQKKVALRNFNFNQLQLAACWITESLKIENAAIAKTFTITKLSFAIKVRDFSWNRFFEHQNSNYSDVALFLTSETTVKESRRKVINQKKSDSCFYCSHIPWWFA